jgi:SAM-dependent methyltransferase
MLPTINKKAWMGLGVLVACALGAASFGQRDKPPFSCEVHVRLPAASADPETQRIFGKLSIDAQKLSEELSRSRVFRVPLKAREDTITVVYEFWPKIYTHIVRTKVVKVQDGAVVDVDLRDEDPQQPDRIEAAQVPTPMPVVEHMCKLAGIRPGDIVFDIGCGDGRMVMTAVANFGAARGVGVDIDPVLIEQCGRGATKAGLQNKIEFRVGDALQLQSLDDATVVLLYVGEHLNLKLRPILRKHLKPGARIVSHDFDMGDWFPDRTEKFMEENVLGKQEEFRLHLWIIK